MPIIGKHPCPVKPYLSESKKIFVQESFLVPLLKKVIFH